MRVFRVVTEKDGEPVKAPGETTTPMIREEYRYAAEAITEVWDAIGFLLNDPERDVIAIIEESPSIIVLNPTAPEPDKETP